MMVKIGLAVAAMTILLAPAGVNAAPVAPQVKSDDVVIPAQHVRQQSINRRTDVNKTWRRPKPPSTYCSGCNIYKQGR